MKLNQQGYTLAGALCLLAVMSIFMALSVPLWQRVKQRENEQELIFRGKEYVEAIARYHQRFHTYPADLETLEKQRFIRKLYKDPMTRSGKWKILTPNSVIETGEAGKVNDPAKKKDRNRDELEQENDRGNSSTPFGFGEQEPREDDGKDEKTDSDEEPETETVGPVVGVASRSKKESMKVYNGQTTYNKWVFVFAVQQQPIQPQPPGGKKPPKGGKKPAKPNQGPGTSPNPQGQPPIPDDESE